MEVWPGDIPGAANITDNLALRNRLTNTDKWGSVHMRIQRFLPVSMVDAHMVTIGPVKVCCVDSTAFDCPDGSTSNTAPTKVGSSVIGVNGIRSAEIAAKGCRYM